MKRLLLFIIASTAQPTVAVEDVDCPASHWQQARLASAAQYISNSGVQLCALGADGQVLEQYGLKVRYAM